MYFHPFQDPNHNTGCIGSWPSAISLHFVAPTISRRGTTFRYLRNMGMNSTTFQNYTKPSHRIYVMGHCNIGSSQLSTETGSQEICTAAELARIFLQHGLPANSSAHIRIHACYSGVNSGANVNDCFAYEFREEMRNLPTGNGQPRNHWLGAVQYPNITVRGYTKAVGIYIGTRWAGWTPQGNNYVDYP
jgi:hypothetical protein